MEGRCMEFVAFEEMELFMSRYMAMVYDDRLYIRKDHMRALSAINKISNVSFGSVLPDDFISIVFECTRRRNKRTYLNLMHCLLSLSVSLHDPWSATRLLSKVCPKVLPALRRCAQESVGCLDIMSVLISYVMTAPVEDDHNTDEEFHANFPVLKNFVDTVITMNEALQDDMKPIEAVKSALEMAAEFMITIPNYASPSIINKMIVYLNKNIDQLSTNFTLINSRIVSNKYQTKTSNQTDAYVIAISLCDRLMCLNVTEDIGVVSPLFKTPNDKAVVSSSETPVNQKVVAEQNATPDLQESRIANFINIDTPVSRPLDRVENYVDVAVSMKENISFVPESLERKTSYKKLIPTSKKNKTLYRKLNSFADAKGNQRKCTKKDVRSQRKITDFFKKYS